MFQDDTQVLLATARADLAKVEAEAKDAAGGVTAYRSFGDCDRIAREYPERKRLLEERIAELQRQLGIGLA